MPFNVEDDIPNEICRRTDVVGIFPDRGAALSGSSARFWPSNTYSGSEPETRSDRRGAVQRNKSSDASLRSLSSTGLPFGGIRF